MWTPKHNFTIIPHSSTGTYVQTLAIIVSRDVLKFIAMFLIVLVVFGGAFYFSLRYGESLVAGNNTESVSSTNSGEGGGVRDEQGGINSGSSTQEQSEVSLR